MDPFADLKARQREAWVHFAPNEVHTMRPAAMLVEFADVAAGARVLDVATGTGVVAITAARRGGRVTALDLTPELLARARENAAIAGVDVAWHEGDVEDLPFEDASFDVVLSQFGHIFAPRPEVATRELLRVLRPGGRIGFSTWPEEHFFGRMFALVSRYLPPTPGVPPVTEWGDPAVVRERLGSAVRDLRFDRGTVVFPALSPQHYRAGMETTSGQIVKLLAMLRDDAAKLAAYRADFHALISEYHADNGMKQYFLLTRATKV